MAGINELRRVLTPLAITLIGSPYTICDSPIGGAFRCNRTYDPSSFSSTFVSVSKRLAATVISTCCAAIITGVGLSAISKSLFRRTSRPLMASLCQVSMADRLVDDFVANGKRRTKKEIEISDNGRGAVIVVLSVSRYAGSQELISALGSRLIIVRNFVNCRLRLALRGSCLCRCLSFTAYGRRVNINW